jgi:hypothetical protein
MRGWEIESPKHWASERALRDGDSTDSEDRGVDRIDDPAEQSTRFRFRERRQTSQRFERRGPISQ